MQMIPPHPQICDVSSPGQMWVFEETFDKLFIGCHKPFSVHFHQLYVL